MCCRPVLAILEVEVLHIDEDRREEVYKHVIGQQGPPDGTIIVSMTNHQEFDDDTVDEVLNTFGEIGEIILVR